MAKSCLVVAGISELNCRHFPAETRRLKPVGTPFWNRQQSAGWAPWRLYLTVGPVGWVWEPKGSLCWEPPHQVCTMP